MKVDTLESGADDYVVKPFSAPELVARYAATFVDVPERASSLRSPTLAAGRWCSICNGVC
jgi:DNA-binding response OmpR family regulator